jgi:flavin-dependent dehydrogenase
VVPLVPLSRTYEERVLAVGDAAGQVKPTAGGGIYYGMLGAQDAAIRSWRRSSEERSPAMVSPPTRSDGERDWALT